MLNPRRLIPAPIRPAARRLAERLSGPRPTAAPASQPMTDGLDTDAVLRLLYGDDMSTHTRTEAHGTLNGQPIRGLSAIRTLLGTLDRQLSPSPVSVRFQRSDIRFATVDGLKLALDRADASVSLPILTASAWEPHLTSAFRMYVRPGGHVVDVGANIGYFTVLAGTLVGPTGRVTAIEPNSENCRLILASVAANSLSNVELIPVALDRQRGWAHFSTHVGSNGGLRPDAIEGIIDDAGQIVPVFRLDDLVEHAVDFLKIDVEGAEYRAMMGARGIIDRDRPIVSSEFSVEMIERISGVPARDYLEFFTSRNYAINIIDRSDGSLRPYPSADALLADWPDHLHLEDLLFLP